MVPGLAAVSRFIDRMVEFYHRTLLWVLRRQRATLLVTFATIALTLIMYVLAPKGFSAAAGHLVDHGGDRGRTRRLVRRDAAASERGLKHHQGRS
ncbi:hypothetical protein ACQPTN_25860 [Bradyrhizobium sp. 13971]